MEPAAYIEIVITKKGEPDRLLVTGPLALLNDFLAVIQRDGAKAFPLEAQHPVLEEQLAPRNTSAFLALKRAYKRIEGVYARPTWEWIARQSDTTLRASDGRIGPKTLQAIRETQYEVLGK